MRRESERDAVAQRHLVQLGRELAAAGLAPGALADAPEKGPEASPGEPGLGRPSVIAPPGRHARERPAAGPAGLGGPAWLSKLPRLPYGPGHLAAVAIAVAVALGITAWIVVRSAPSVVPAPVAHVAPGSSAAASSSASNLPSLPASSSPAPSAGSPVPATTVVVDVAGKVRRPGIVRLPAGARVVDAIRSAGGARRGADLSSLNLARPVTDGEQILVGRHGSSSVAPAGPSGGTGSPGPVGKVSLNTATLAQLDTLPGVGPVTAQKILDWRTAHGRFSAVSELLEVDGIGDKTMADIAPHVTL